jgi:hypothetical protein
MDCTIYLKEIACGRVQATIAHLLQLLHVAPVSASYL